MKYISLQLTKGDCGLACVKTLLANINNDESYCCLPTDLSMESCSFFDLKQYGKEFGLEFKGLFCEEKEKIFEYKDTIVQLINNEKYHFVIFQRIIKGEVLIFDPSIGELKIDKKIFLDNFSGNFLLADKVNRKKLAKKKKTKSTVIFFTSSFFLDFLLIVLMAFFYNKNEPIILLFFCILLLILNTISKLIFISIISRKFDKFSLDKINWNNKNVSFTDKYSIFQTYKYNEILQSIKEPSQCFILLIVFFVLILNDINQIFALIILVAMSLFFHLCFDRELLLKENKLFLKESQNEIDEVKQMDNLKDIANDKNNYLFFFFSKWILLIFVTLVDLIIFQGIKGTNNMSDFFLFSGLYIEIVVRFNNLLNSEQKRAKKNKITAKFKSIIKK